MCGIAILASKSNYSTATDALLTQMLDTMQHRGPDDRGILIQQGIQMGMVRLSIVDVSSGAQPIYNEDKSLAIVCNGEIYNADALRNDLLANGHVFATQSDIEVILHLYEDRSEQCLSFIEGIFAFAIWDKQINKLFVARDRVGVKPLYYSDLGTHFAFASEVRALSCISEVNTEIHSTAVSDYHAFRYIPGEKTIFSGIHRLLPGHFAEVTRETLRIHRYWHPTYRPVRPEINRNPIHELQQLMDASIKKQLSTEVASAVLLSGGLDSTGLLALRSRYVQADQAITIVFEPPADHTPQIEYSELHHAKQVANHYGVKHFVQIVGANEALEALPQIIAALDEPIADPTSIPLWFASRLAHAKNAKVIYSGEGLDELFAGYEIYGHTRWLSKLAQLPRSWRIFLRDLMVRHRLRGAGLLQRSLSPIEDWYQGVGGLFTPAELPMILKAPPDHGAIARCVRSIIGSQHNASPMQRMLLFDLLSWLPDNTLAKSDKISMAHSVELRVPYLDEGIVEFALTSPDHMKWGPRRGKQIVRQAFADCVPSFVINRQKAGFNVPISSWIFGEWKSFTQDMILSPKACTRSLYREDIQSLFHATGKNRERAGRLLFALLSMELWLRQNPHSNETLQFLTSLSG